MNDKNIFDLKPKYVIENEENERYVQNRLSLLPHQQYDEIDMCTSRLSLLLQRYLDLHP